MKIVVIINRSSGELEWILPVIVQLQTDGFHVDIVFLRNQEYIYLRKSNTLLNLLEQLEVKISVYESNTKATISLFEHVYNSVVRILPGFCAKYSHLQKFKVSSFFKRYDIEVSPNLLLIDNSFYKDLKRDSGQGIHHTIFTHFNPKAILVYPHAPKLKIQDPQSHSLKPLELLKVNEPTSNIYYNRYPLKARYTWQITDNIENEMIYTNNRGLQSFHVKSPRYQLEWVRKRFANNNLTVLPELPEYDTPRVLILSKLQGAIFRQNPTINPIDLIAQIIQTLEANNVLWKIKPHPRDNIDDLRNMIHRESQQSFTESLFEGALENPSIPFSYCISVPTSAVLDTVLVGIPTIEYFPTDKQNTIVYYESPYQKKSLVQGCSNLIEMHTMIKNFHDKRDQQNMIDKQQHHLSQCFSSGHNSIDVIKKIIQITT